MTELEILQKRFSNMAQQFPGLIHILTTWPKDEKEPKLPRYMPTKDNLLIIWGDGLVRWPAPFLCTSCYESISHIFSLS